MVELGETVLNAELGAGEIKGVSTEGLPIREELLDFADGPYRFRRSSIIRRCREWPRSLTRSCAETRRPLRRSCADRRFETYTWNRQSALLQEVKGVLARMYPDTAMTGDGQIVLVKFGSYNVEVVPAFELRNGGYWICDTNNGGSYKRTSPWSEAAHIDTVDKATNGNLRPLIRMLKAWQANCSVPIKSFQLELTAAEFIVQSPWKLYDYFWFDWMTRGFFAYLYHRANGFVTIPGCTELVALGNDWQSRCQSAYDRAAKACDFEKWNLIEEAGDEWQKIFGSQMPRDIS
jgi:hypothetical protein